MADKVQDATKKAVNDQLTWPDALGALSEVMMRTRPPTPVNVNPDMRGIVKQASSPFASFQPQAPPQMAQPQRSLGSLLLGRS